MTIPTWRAIGFVTLIILVFLLLSCIPSRAASKEQPKFDLSPSKVKTIYFDQRWCKPKMPLGRIGDAAPDGTINVTEDMNHCSEQALDQPYPGWIRCENVKFEFVQPTTTVKCGVAYFELKRSPYSK